MELDDLPTICFKAYTGHAPSEVLRFWYCLFLQLVGKSNHEWDLGNFRHTYTAALDVTLTLPNIQRTDSVISHGLVTSIARVGFRNRVADDLLYTWCCIIMPLYDVKVISNNRLHRRFCGGIIKIFASIFNFVLRKQNMYLMIFIHVNICGFNATTSVTFCILPMIWNNYDIAKIVHNYHY